MNSCEAWCKAIACGELPTCCGCLAFRTSLPNGFGVTYFCFRHNKPCDRWYTENVCLMQVFTPSVRTLKIGAITSSANVVEVIYICESRSGEAVLRFQFIAVARLQKNLLAMPNGLSQKASWIWIKCNRLCHPFCLLKTSWRQFVKYVLYGISWIEDRWRVLFPPRQHDMKSWTL